MKGDKPKFINLFCFLVFAFLLTPIKAQNCTYTHWGSDKNPCPDGYNEIFKDVAASVELSNRWCCLADTDDELSQKRDATNCRATTCLSSSSGDLCSSLHERYIDNVKLKYEDVMREPCARGAGQGVVALCCQPNTTESVLVTTLGAEENEFPHQAKLKLPGHCGGTVYNKRFIITASHCIVTNGNVSDVSGMRVILGTNIADVDSEEFVYEVKRAIPHEKYSRLAGQPEHPKGENGKYYNDIALLELDRDITFTRNVKALEIAPKGFDPFKYANNSVIVGWGTTDTLALTIHLQKANFALRKDSSCFGDDKWDGLDEMVDQLLCVGGIWEGKWSYTAGGGDSGGPAICRKEDGHPVLCGVTSFGGDDGICAEESFCPPSVYAEVAHFHDWIVKHAGRQDPKTLYQPRLYGKKVEQGRYEHQVHITSSTGKSCGGTLIAPDIVITAGQCAARGDGIKNTYADLKVTSGVTNRAQGNGHTFKVKKAAILPGFKRVGEPVNITKQGDRVIMTDNYYTNDLAVLKLEGKVPISPSKLPSLQPFWESYFVGEEISLSRNNSNSTQLMSREFKLLDLYDCQTRMNRMTKANLTVKVDKNILCGVETYSGGSTCDRELGGGLICLGRDGKEVLCGVQTFRLCEFSIPNGFINMGLYSLWVAEMMKEL